MWLKSLHVENFRGFEKLDVTFDEHVTLLVGGNGAGKTAILDAIATAMNPFVAALDERAHSGLQSRDTRRIVFEHGTPPTRDLQPQLPMIVGASAILPGRPEGQTWSREKWIPDAGENEHLLKELRGTANLLSSDVRRGIPVALPVFAHYGVQRLRPHAAPSGDDASLGNRFDGYHESVDIAVSRPRLFNWLWLKTLEEVQEWQTNPSYRHPQLRAVFAAIESCVDGVSDLSVSLKDHELRLRIGERFQAFEMLSAGYQNVVALVADLARRAAVLNPQYGERAAFETPGVVLVDEIELHLHPKWQRTVIGSLRRSFPKMQFILTTHSPQVLSTVEREQVRLFEDNRLVAARGFVEGRSSNELLEDIFGVPARPPATKAALDELFKLIDDGDYASACTKLSALETRLGRDDGDIVRARWILESEAGSEPAAPIAS